MFKYVWIIILAIVYIIWSIKSILDMIETYRKCNTFLDNLEYYTLFWLIEHIICIFIGSLAMFLEG